MKTILLVALFLLFLPELVLLCAAIAGYTYGVGIRLFCDEKVQDKAAKWVQSTLARGKASVDAVNTKIRNGFTVIDGGKA